MGQQLALFSNIHISASREGMQLPWKQDQERGLYCTYNNCIGMVKEKRISPMTSVTFMNLSCGPLDNTNQTSPSNSTQAPPTYLEGNWKVRITILSMGERKLKGEWFSSSGGRPATSVPRMGTPGTPAEPDPATTDLVMGLRLATVALSVSLAWGSTGRA